MNPGFAGRIHLSASGHANTRLPHKIKANSNRILVVPNESCVRFANPSRRKFIDSYPKTKICKNIILRVNYTGAKPGQYFNQQTEVGAEQRQLEAEELYKRANK